SASSGEKLKGSNVARPNNAEVSPIQRGQGRDPEALRRCHNRCVDSSKLQVPVSPDKLGNAQPVRRVDWFRRQASAREVAEESHFGPGTKSCSQQIADLGDNELRHNQRAGMLAQQLETNLMVPIVLVDVGVKGSGVDEKRYPRASARRMASTRAETSLLPLRPASAATNLRFVPPTYGSTASR